MKLASNQTILCRHNVVFNYLKLIISVSLRI